MQFLTHYWKDLFEFVEVAKILRIKKSKGLVSSKYIKGVERMESEKAFLK